MKDIQVDRDIVFGFGDRNFSNVSILERELKAEGYSDIRIFTAKQIHSVEIEVIMEASSEANAPQCDGLITNLADTALIIKTADCVPVFFYDKTIGIVGAAHCGWLGSYENISAKMIKECIRQGSGLNNIKVIIGPAVGPCCYPVYGDRYRKIVGRYPEFADKIFPVYNNTTCLDLVRFNYLRLVSAGIQAGNIRYSVTCTSCRSDKFYSYRRGDRGRHMLHFIFRKS